MNNTIDFNFYTKGIETLTSRIAIVTVSITTPNSMTELDLIELTSTDFTSYITCKQPVGKLQRNRLSLT